MRTIPDIKKYDVFENLIFVESTLWQSYGKEKLQYNKILEFKGNYVHHLNSDLFKFNSWEVFLVAKNTKIICNLRINFSFKEILKNYNSRYLNGINFSYFLNSFKIKSWDSLANYDSIFLQNLNIEYYRDLARAKLKKNALENLSDWYLTGGEDLSNCMAEIKNCNNDKYFTIPNFYILNNLEKINYELAVKFSLSTPGLTCDDLIKNSILSLALDKVALSADIITKGVIETMEGRLLSGVPNAESAIQ